MKLLQYDCQKCQDNNDEKKDWDTLHVDCCRDDVCYQVGDALAGMRENSDTGGSLPCCPVIQDQTGD